MALGEDLERIAQAASEYAEPGERVTGVVAAEPTQDERVYLCAFSGAGRTWLALDREGRPIASRSRVREAVSIAAMCELAGEAAAGGNLEELRAQLVTLRVTENPVGIDEAEDAALALERAIGAPPRVATPSYLDEIGEATRRLERALGDGGGSPFAAAMSGAAASVSALAAEVESNYKRELV